MTSQTLTLEFESVKVFVQIIELEKQKYVYVGEGLSLDSMSVAVPGIGGEQNRTPASTVVLSNRETDTDSKRLSEMLCRKSGTSIVASYNIPPQSMVSEGMKQQIFAALVQHIC